MPALTAVDIMNMYTNFGTDVSYEIVESLRGSRALTSLALLETGLMLMQYNLSPITESIVAAALRVLRVTTSFTFKTARALSLRELEACVALEAFQFDGIDISQVHHWPKLDKLRCLSIHGCHPSTNLLQTLAHSYPRLQRLALDATPLLPAIIANTSHLVALACTNDAFSFPFITFATQHGRAPILRKAYDTDDFWKL
jgi:hypothetical protein